MLWKNLSSGTDQSPGKTERIVWQGYKKAESMGTQGLLHAYPENTLESFKAAAELKGITGVELDIQFSKDKKIVVFHDENASRVTELTKI